MHFRKETCILATNLKCAPSECLASQTFLRPHRYGLMATAGALVILAIPTWDAYIPMPVLFLQMVILCFSFSRLDSWRLIIAFEFSCEILSCEISVVFLFKSAWHTSISMLRGFLSPWSSFHFILHLNPSSIVPRPKKERTHLGVIASTLLCNKQFYLDHNTTSI